MKQYTKQNHFIMAIDLNSPLAHEELVRIAYVFRLYGPLNQYERAVVDALHNLEQERKLKNGQL